MTSRDFELCIKILKEISTGECQSDFQSGESNDELYLYHLELLEDAGLIEFDIIHFMGGSSGFKNPPRLTWNGNDFLDAVQNDTLWENSKVEAKKRGIELSEIPLDLILAYTKMKAKELLAFEVE